MRVLHIVKTSDGARWAALQACELIRAGVEIDVALPSLDGRSMDLWKASGARLHAADLSFPATRPWLASAVIRKARALVNQVRPDVIHSHFVSTTLTLRAALGRQSRVPRVFQVPGPLHLEHAFYRRSEIASAGPADYWIASSRYTRELYLHAGVSARRVFLSYYATENQPNRAGVRTRWGLPADAVVVGNINMFYAPKLYLGQRTGLKAHENAIRALAMVTAARPNVYGVLAGGPWGNAQQYFERLRRRAHVIAPGRIILPGPLAPGDVLAAWREFDCAVHVPLSGKLRRCGRTSARGRPCDRRPGRRPAGAGDRWRYRQHRAHPRSAGAGGFDSRSAGQGRSLSGPGTRGQTPRRKCCFRPRARPAENQAHLLAEYLVGQSTWAVDRTSGRIR